MTELQFLLDQLQRTFDGEAWHGDPVLTILREVEAGQAAARPIPNAHTIWELVLHMAIWKDAVRWRIEGHPRQPTDAENFPAVTDTSDAAWQQALARLIEAHRALVAAVSGLDSARLAAELPGGGGLTQAGQIHGVIQHDLYHAGQIALLKKAGR